MFPIAVHLLREPYVHSFCSCDCVILLLAFLFALEAFVPISS